MKAPAPKLKIPLDGAASLLGRRIGALLIPVTAAMLLVSWSVLNLSTLYIGRNRTPFILLMDEKAHESIEGKIYSSLVNALVVVAVVSAVTFIILLLYNYGCEKILFGWLMLSAGSALSVMLSAWLDLTCTRFQIPYDTVTGVFLLWNIGVVGLVSMFYYSHPVLAQAYLVVTSIVVAWFLTFLPEWTTWSMLMMVAFYDVVAVMCPRGPLRLLVEAADRRNQPLPGFVYDSCTESALASAQNQAGGGEGAEEMQIVSESHIVNRREKAGTQSLSPAARLYYVLYSRPFKLGMGDFVFYSLLCGRAVGYSFLPWVASLVTILLGLVSTLISLVLFKSKARALPALPLSICSSILVFFLYRYVVVPFDWFATLSALAL